MTEDKNGGNAGSDVNATVADVPPKRRWLRFWGVVALAVVATVLGLALLVNIFQRKQEERNPFFRVVELTDDTVDPAVWGKNFPLQYDDYLKQPIRYVRITAEARPNQKPQLRPIRAPSSLSRDSKRIHA